MRRYANAYQNNINTKGNTNMKKNEIRISFASHERRINKGAHEELLGWFDAYDECKALIKAGKITTVLEYATLASKVSKSHLLNTINGYIGHCKWAEDNGYKRSEFTSMGHIRKTKNPPKKAGKSAKAEKRSALDEVFDQAKHLSRASRQSLINKLLETL